MNNSMHHHAHNQATQHQEYSARFGLKNALNDIEIAQQLAEAKYRSLVGRDIVFSEILDIRQLILELKNWVTVNENLPENVATH